MHEKMCFLKYDEGHEENIDWINSWFMSDENINSFLKFAQNSVSSNKHHMIRILFQCHLAEMWMSSLLWR